MTRLAGESGGAIFVALKGKFLQQGKVASSKNPGFVMGSSLES
jgi:hypothetical protein